MVRIFKSLKHALNGFRAAYRFDKNFRLEVVWGFIFLVLFIYSMPPLEIYEILLLILAYVVVLIAELINTAFETAFAKLHPAYDRMIGASKDIAASAVLLGGFFGFIVVLFIFFNHF
ncbi:MAG: diacylglycerol kinase [Candidatus Paceibacterota bacterium]